jgi:hypothetical protein
LPNARALIPPDAYRGTAPIAAIVDAYGDPAVDPLARAMHFYGGGHGDGTCNAIVSLDLRTLRYTLTDPPTPSSAYPPDYLVSGYRYPSGLGLDWFRTRAQLTDPRDLPYAAPVSKPVSTHQYGSLSVRAKRGVPREMHGFYAQYKVFDLTSRTWTDAHEKGQAALAAKVAAQSNRQFPGLGANIGPSVPLQQGTMALYDDVTDSFFVTLIAGDAGGGWRNYFFRYEPSTQAVTKVFRPGIPCRESMGWLKVGRWVYGFTSAYLPYPNQTIDRGFRFNIDSEAIEYFRLTGAVVSFRTAPTQEAAPTWYDASTGKIYSWNHQGADRGALYELSLSALGGAGGRGTVDDPWQWTQTRVELSGTPPANVSYRYHSPFFVPGWNVVVVMPHSNSALYALRL